MGHQSGPNTFLCRLTPTFVTANATAIATGGSHSMTLHYTPQNNGILQAWGANNAGQLGNGTTSPAGQRESVQVQNISEVTEFAAGGSTSAAINTYGDIHMWGNNNFGQLGDGTAVNRHIPRRVVGSNGGFLDLGSPVKLPYNNNQHRKWNGCFKSRIGISQNSYLTYRNSGCRLSFH
jgi:alpha-tubulin suppressor-like RCC1 family protein